MKTQLWPTLLVTFALVWASLASGQPTVNGRFYGDGDNALYQPYATSAGGSVLYSYLDVPTRTLYVALVVSHAVNDLVCAQKGSGNAYLQSGNAGDPIRWTSHRDCKRASDSEFASFTLECAPNSPNSWMWQQALGCSTVAGPPPSSWVSAPSCPASLGVWPPSIVASTSWVANVNAFQSNPSPAWNMYVVSTALGDWKTPFVAAFPNDVTQVPGYPTYSAAHQWEWSMVYEWSVNLGPGGADCGDEPIFFVTGASHHSPPKSGPENDIFPPPSQPPIISDWGDLPDSYGTLNASNGARHYVTVNGPYLGAQLQTEGDGVPTADASGDGDEEDGLTIPQANWEEGTTQQIQVTVGNAPGGAVLGGWFDWNGDGDFGDPGEFFTWNVSNGVNNLNVTVGNEFQWETEPLHVRLRVFSNASKAPSGGPTLVQSDSAGVGTDGEVEDHFYPISALPVTLNAFASDVGPGRELVVRWQSASETDNVGFQLLGRIEGEWRPIGDLVASKGMNSALPQSYEIRIDAAPGLAELELLGYDSRGRPDRFGPFLPGDAYGEEQPVERVDWKGPRRERELRLRDRGFAAVAGIESSRAAADRGAVAQARWRKLSRPSPGEKKGREASAESGVVTHVAVTEAGIQRVTYEALRDGGLDLAGVASRDLAVTWRGEAVPRWAGPGNVFGPGDRIEFVGRPPEGSDARYVDAALYQIAVNPSRAVEARKVGRGNARSHSGFYGRQTVVDRPGFYHSQSPTGDPWVDRVVLARPGLPATVTLDLPVAGPMLDGVGGLVVGLGTITDLPPLRGADGSFLPEHNVEVSFRGPGGSFVPITTASISGQADWRIEADLPNGLLEPGQNQVQLRFSTDYFFSLVVVDTYGAVSRSPYEGPSLDFPPDPGARGYRIDGFASASIVAYAEEGDGSLARLAVSTQPAAGGWAAELRQVEAERIWVSEAPHTPSVFTTADPGDLLASPGDLVVIADSSFLGTPALDAYVADKAAFDPVVVDVEDVFNAFGYGMAVPAAITDYLRARDAVSPFTHVQLVGTDCYDRLGYLSDCLSMIPLPTAPVGVTIYSPSQNRLVDLDGDGVGDKAVGQFSVRDEAELATIVDKGASWSEELSSAGTALFIAEETDGTFDFRAQIDRLQAASWPTAEVLDMTDHPDVSTARQELSSALDRGQTVTVFSGHSSPVVWAFRSLLAPATAAALTNEGLPTLMVPLACETTYDSSPSANVLGHQLLYAGDRGALAISGAVSLASLSDNERMARYILDGLRAGLTLGEAVLSGRRELGTDFQELQDNWFTQGDATAILRPGDL